MSLDHSDEADIEHGHRLDTANLETAKLLKLNVSITKPIPYTFDLGNLLAIDGNPLTSTAEEALAATARDGAQALLNQLLTICPISSTPAGVLLTLPPPSTPLPREKPIPVEKAMTRWQQFAAKKGIKPKKREGKMVFDEDTGEWVPKWGYKGINKKGEGDWLVEVDDKMEKKGQKDQKGESNDVGHLRQVGRRERKERIKRNERRMRANERGRRKSGT